MSASFLAVLGAILVGAGFGLIMPPMVLGHALRFALAGPLATLIVWRFRQ